LREANVLDFSRGGGPRGSTTGFVCEIGHAARRDFIHWRDKQQPKSSSRHAQPNPIENGTTTSVEFVPFFDFPAWLTAAVTVDSTNGRSIDRPK